MKRAQQRVTDKGRELRVIERRDRQRRGGPGEKRKCGGQ